jgi:hypothetical protein
MLPGESDADVHMQASTSSNPSPEIQRKDFTESKLRLKLKPLSPRQERRLVDYVEEEMIRISGEYKKR